MQKIVKRKRNLSVNNAAARAIETLEMRQMLSTTLADWTFETTAPATAGPFAPEAGVNAGSSAATGVHAGTSTYSSPAGNGTAHSFSSNNWATGDYYQFKSVSTGYGALSLTFDQTSSATGPGQFSVQYSTDGSTFTALSGSAYNISSSTSVVSWSTTVPVTTTTHTFDLSSITGLNNDATVAFRVVDASALNASGGAVGSGGTDRIDNVIIAAAQSAPSLTSLTPATGNIAGGNTIAINGSGLTGTTAVTFNSTSYTSGSFTFVSDSKITFVVPSTTSATSFPVTVTNPFGTSNPETFTYTTSPTVSSINPIYGPLNGSGTPITINGSGFTGLSTVTIGGAAVSDTYVSSTQLTATAPPSATPGPVDVVVSNGALNSGTGASTDQFTYLAAPTINSGGVSPAFGPDSIGTTVTISGTNFVNGSVVSFGGTTEATTFVNSTTLTAVSLAPGAVAPDGAVNVTVTDPGGTATASGAFTYQITTVANFDAAASGTSVTIDSSPVVTEIISQPGTQNGTTYSNFAFLIQDSSGAAEVFGASTLAAFTNYAPQVGDQLGPVTGTRSVFSAVPELAPTAAISAVGTVGAAGTTQPNNDNFPATTTPYAPIVSTIPALNVSTATLPTNIEGYMVQLKGVLISTSQTSATFTTTSFTGAVTDSAGNTMQLYYSVSNALTENLNLFGVTIPKVAVDIYGYDTIQTGTTNVAQFIPQYLEPDSLPPVVNSITPNAGPLNSTTTSVVINGFGFEGAGSGLVGTGYNASSVMFGTTAATFTVTSDSTITATVPSSATTSTVAVIVSNTIGASAASLTPTTSDSYTYTTLPVVGSVAPNVGNTSSTTTVVITGSSFIGLSGAGAVKFGSFNASSYTVNSSTQITAVAPAEAAGQVNVLVTGSGGTSSVTSTDYFTYEGNPTVATVSPNAGLTGGLSTVTITGTGFTGATAVTFGTTAAVSYTVSSGTQIVAVDPAHTVGTVDVIITTPVHASAANPSTDSFTYNPTTIAAVEAQASGTLVTIDSNPVITEILSVGKVGTAAANNVNGYNYSNYSFLVQDSTGSMDIFGALPAGYTPAVGDTISVSGKYSPYSLIPELGTITAISKTGTHAPYYTTPAVTTVAAANSATQTLGTTGIEGNFLTINNATINFGTNATFGTSSFSGTLTDTTGTMTIFYYPTSYSAANTFFFGTATPSPTTVYNVSGIVQVYGGTQPEFIPISDVLAPTLPIWLSDPAGTDTYSSTTHALVVNSPSTIIADPGTDEPTITFGATTTLNVSTGLSTVHVGSLTISNNSTVTLLTASPATNAAVDILIDAGTLSTSGGTLNIGDNFVDVVGGSLSAVEGAITAGTLTTTDTAATGSSVTNGTYSLGTLAAQVPGSPSTLGASVAFGSFTPAATDVVVRYTYYGDANFDGFVDGSDYNKIDNGFSNHLTGWGNGDFNNDGVVNGSDYTLIDNAFNTESASVLPTAKVASLFSKGPAISAIPAATYATTAAATGLDKKAKSADAVDSLGEVN